MSTAIVYDELYKEHRPHLGHPECSERCDAVMAAIDAGVDAGTVTRLRPRPATIDDVARCHSRDYITTARDDITGGSTVLSSGDTDVCEASFEIALLAAGGVLEAIDAVASRRVKNAFCCVRPPGHHATATRGMGFCVFNNVAIGARYAQVKHGAGNVLIVDWDVHHGNGTQEIFYGDPSVFYFSTHQWPFYPGTGTIHEKGVGGGKGTTLNCPLAAGAGGRDVVESFERKLAPAMRLFKPEFVFISAGFDSRKGDLLGNFVLDDGDFFRLTELMLGLADQYAGGRLVSVLEGGYTLAGLGSACAAHVRSLSSH